MMFSRLWIIVGLFAMIGCGGSSVKPKYVLHPVTGTVTLDGAPLKRAEVTFIPLGGGVESTGMTDEKGVYQLAVRENEVGATAGDHKVYIRKRLKPDGSEIVPGPNSGVGTESLPPKYSDMQRTTLKATVEAGGKKKIDFQLTTK